nr:histidine kinase [Bacteroidota bacterium]
MKLKAIFDHRIAYHIYFWIGFAIVLGLIMYRDGGDIPAIIRYLLLYSIPLLSVTYLHFFLFDKFFKHRKYLLYAIMLLMCICLSVALMQIINLYYYSNILIVNSLIDVVLVISFTTGIRFFKNSLYSQYKIQEVEAKQAKTELDLLKRQVNPHFLFNTLNNLYALALVKSNLVPEIVLKLSGLMRYLLDTSKKTWVTPEDEWNYLKDYVELEKLRLSFEHDITMKTEGNLKGNKIAPMILLPLVENIFKHGINARSKKFEAIIELVLKSSVLEFTVSNTLPPEMESKK